MAESLVFIPLKATLAQIRPLKAAVGDKTQPPGMGTVVQG